MAEAEASRDRVRARIQEVADRIVARANRPTSVSNEDFDRPEQADQPELSLVREE